MFVKEGSKIEFEEFMEWGDFLKELKSKAPIFLLNLYLRDVLRRDLFKFHSRTPLVSFSIIGNSKMVELILHMKPNNGWSMEHDKALEIAVRRGHVNVARRLKQLFTTNIPSNVLNMTILLATENDQLDVLRVLMDDVTNLDKIVTGKIIRFAARHGKMEMIKLFEQKFDENHFENSLAEKYSNGETIFHDIAKRGHLEMLKYLCQETSRLSRHPLQKDHFQRTPIHYAAAKGHLEIVKFLTHYSKNPNVADKFGWTPSKIARTEGFLEIEAYLLEQESNAEISLLYKLMKKIFR